MASTLVLRCFAILFVSIPLCLSFQFQEKASSIIPGAYLVEFHETGNPNLHDDFYTALASARIIAMPRMQLYHTLFSGASFYMNEDEDYAQRSDQVSALSMVKSIWPLKHYPLPVTTSTNVFAGSSDGTVSWENKRRDPNHNNDTYAVHEMGGVDLLQNEGYTGKGLFVAIIDTGVDYNHPALGGGFGPGYKIAHGYDLVGDAYDGNSVPVPDPDPFSNCQGHGTHVAGIIGANVNPFGFTGVVPDATLGMYRVFGCFDNTSDDVLIAAFNMAFDDGADIITASIGGPSGWSEEPWAVAVSRIVDAGTPCTLAAGNTGSSGIFNSSTAAIGRGVLSVGSVDSITTPVNLTLGDYLIDGESPIKFGYSLGVGGFPSATLPLHALDFDVTAAADGCSPLPADTPDLSNKFVLIRRGTCTFATKIKNAQAFGAEYVVFYNNQPSGTIAPADGTGDGILGAAMVSADQGALWIKLMIEGRNVALATLTPTESSFEFVTTFNTLTGSSMSTFSSWSPTYEMDITPIVSAPGGNILSTWPLSLGGYQVLSGTSMATPYIAGIVAIIKQVRGKDIDPGTISNLLSSTAVPLLFNDGSAKRYGYYAPIIQQGGGLVDGYAAVHADTILRTTNIAFNDTRHFLYSAGFLIQNTGSDEVTYNFTHVPAASAYALDDGSLLPASFPPDTVDVTATIEFDVESITVPPGDYEGVFISLNLPVGLERGRLPIYSGFIAVHASNGENFTIPYAGVDADLAVEATVMDVYDSFPFLTTSSDPFAAPINPGTLFTLSRNPAAQISESAPAIAVGLALGTAYLDIDLIPKNSTNSGGLGSINGFPLTYVQGANFFVQEFLGQLQDGSYAPAGNYTLLVRVLKLGGDPTCESGYETYESFEFEIAYRD